MKIVCERRELFEGVQAAARAVNINSVIQILRHICIEAEGDKVKLTGNDMHIGVERTIQADVKKAGTITVPARILVDMLGCLPDEKVTLELTKDGKCKLTCGKSDYNIIALPADEFPKLEQMEEEAHFVVRVDQLRPAVERVLFAVTNDESKASIAGVHLHNIEDEHAICFVGTDTHRLSVCRCAVEDITGEGIAINIPKRAIVELLKTVGSAETIDVSVNKKLVQFQMENVIFNARLLDGKFINYHRVMPKDPTRRIIIDRAPLEQAVQRADIVVRDISHKLDVEVCPKKLVITAESQNVGSAHEEVPVELEGESYSASYSARFLLDFFDAVGSERIELLVSDPAKAVRLCEPESDEFVYVLMPMA